MKSQPPNPPEAPPGAPYAPPPPAARRGPFERTPFLASILSVIPGLGNVYNGLYMRAFVIALIWFGLLATAVNSNDGPELGVIVPAMVFLWFFNLIDAYRQAVLINYGYTPEGELSDTLGPMRGSGGLVLGGVVFLLGLFGLVQHLFPAIDLSVLFEVWYVPFLAFGGWLFYRAWVERRNRSEEPSGWEPTSEAVLEDEPGPSDEVSPSETL